MRKIFFSLVLALSSVAFMVSCSNDDPDYHTIKLNLESSNDFPVTYWADMSHDSLIINSTDTWEANTNCDWIRFRETASTTKTKRLTYVYGKIYLCKECITINPNTTGADRSTSLQVKANGKQTTLLVVQHPYHNITEPAKNLSGTGDAFSIKLKANETIGNLKFTIYRNASITTEDTWITVPEGVFVGDKKGAEFNDNITVQPNTTGQERRGKITLKSDNGAATDIVVIQEA